MPQSREILTRVKRAALFAWTLYTPNPTLRSTILLPCLHGACKSPAVWHMPISELVSAMLGPSVDSVVHTRGMVLDLAYTTAPQK